MCASALSTPRLEDGLIPCLARSRTLKIRRTNVTVDPQELDLPREDVYAVYNQGGRLLGSSASAPAELVDRGMDGVSVRKYGRKPYRVLQREAIRIIDRPENGGVGLRRPVTIIYAMRSEHLWREVLEAAKFYVAVGALLIGATAGLMLLLLRRILHPLQELAAEAAGISFRSLAFTAPRSALQVRELQPLAETLSAAVSGLRHSFDQQARFVGDAAHELKTSVAVVRSSVQLLMLRPREAKEYLAGLKSILVDNARVEELVARMLVSAKYEEQAFDIDLRSTMTADLSASAHRVVERLKSFTDAQSILVHLQVTTSSIVRISADELDVVTSNLLVNAAQHSAAGSQIDLSIFEKPGFAMLQVEDHGQGISPAALPHVFERFYREDRSRSRETGGAGLGLAICKSIVEAARGKITIESRQAVGTIVTVQLPLA